MKICYAGIPFKLAMQLKRTVLEDIHLMKSIHRFDGEVVVPVVRVNAIHIEGRPSIEILY